MDTIKAVNSFLGRHYTVNAHLQCNHLKCQSLCNFVLSCLLTQNRWKKRKGQKSYYSQFIFVHCWHVSNFMVASLSTGRENGQNLQFHIWDYTQTKNEKRRRTSAGRGSTSHTNVENVEIYSNGYSIWIFDNYNHAPGQFFPLFSAVYSKTCTSELLLL